MSFSYDIDHSSLATVLGEAMTSKSFADGAWGLSSFNEICQVFFEMFEKDKRINIEVVSNVIQKCKIKDGKKFDNFALEFIEEQLKSHFSIKY